MIYRLGLLILLPSLLAASACSAAECHIALFGDSTVSTSYLPAADCIQVFLKEKAIAAYPGEQIRVSNVAEGGDFIGKFLEGGRYERQVLGQFDKINIAIVRYGQNDWKRMPPSQFEKWLERLCDTLEADYPGVVIIPEAGMYFDPAHFSSDTNPRNNQYWDCTRRVAQRRGYTLSDVYAAMIRETEKGNWDQRIRRDGKTLDNRLDAQYPNDKSWFTNGHPNRAGNIIAAETQFEVIRTRFPKSLPAANGIRKGDGARSLAPEPSIRPRTRTILEEKEAVKLEASGAQLVRRVEFPAALNGSYRISCEVAANAPEDPSGQCCLIGDETITNKLLIQPAQAGLRRASLFLEIPPSQNVKTLELRFPNGTTARNLVIAELNWTESP